MCPSLISRDDRAHRLQRSGGGVRREYAVISTIDESPDIAAGVDIGRRRRSGDDVRHVPMTDELMPMPILLAHRITHKLAELRKSGASSGFVRMGRRR
jgi:S-adenosylmethionine synthetase